MSPETNIMLNGQNLTIDQVIKVATEYVKVEIATDALEDVIESQIFITNQVELGKIVYGVTTGFGINADKIIAKKDASKLQRNLLMSHACGVGRPFEEAIVRAVMVIRLNTLLAGHSGVRLETIRLLQQFLNYQIHPVIPIQGSVGASGDLCPLAHMSIPLMGEGRVVFEGQTLVTKALYELPAIQKINETIAKQNAAANSPLDKMPQIIPIELSYKEGIGLSNGTTLMVALGVFGVYQSYDLMDKATLSAALMMEGHCSRPQAFDSKIHAVRKHTGQIRVAKRMREITNGSTMIGIRPIDIFCHFPTKIISEDADLTMLKEPLKKMHDHLKEHINHTENLEIQLMAEDRLIEIEHLLNIKTPESQLKLKHLKSILDFIPQVFCDFVLKFINPDIEDKAQWEMLIKVVKKKIMPQDAYSIRCLPQVFGASMKAIRHAEEIITNELNAVVDNPIIFLRGQVLPDGSQVHQNEVISAGNFHGQPIALVLDYLKLAVAEMGNIMERQVNKMVDSATNDALPAFLIVDAGLNSGLMIPQYTAAALVSENKVLVHPASADSIPTSANQEDHVSMGPIAGRQLLEILGNVQKVLAIHTLTAKQAVDMRLLQFKGKVPVQLAEATQKLYKQVKTAGITTIEEDRFLWEDIEKVIKMYGF
jgi:histidine ammonia-lyase